MPRSSISCSVPLLAKPVRENGSRLNVAFGGRWPVPVERPSMNG
jgi:hypothetical protein